MVKFKFLFIVIVLVGCTKAPITNRYQMITMESQEEIALGEKYSKVLLKRAKISDNKKFKEMVHRVGMKIANVVNQEYNRTHYKWAFHIVENQKKSNAFCLSGGKVFIYTALFQYIESDDELAIVMGHEIAHALARHSAEKKTSSSLAKFGNTLLNFLDKTGEYKNPSIPLERKWKQKMNQEAIEKWIMLPHSRTQEYEADRIGLVLSSKAGFNPKASLSFWKKFAKEHKDKPEYLSTHPSSAHRVDKLKEIMPDMMVYYRQSSK